MDHAGEVHAQEREISDRARVDQVAARDDVLRFHFEVFATEGHDFGLGSLAAEGGDPVGVQTGTVDHIIDRKVTRLALHDDLVAACCRMPRTRALVMMRPSRSAIRCARRSTDLHVVDNAGFRHMNRLDAGRVPARVHADALASMMAQRTPLAWPRS